MSDIYISDSKKLAIVSANMGEGFEEQEDFANPEIASDAGSKVITYGTPEEGMDWLRYMHAKIHSNDFQSAKAKEAYMAVTKSSTQALLQKISSDTTLSPEKKNTYQIELAKLITDRSDTAIDNDLRDPQLALDVLEEVITLPDAVLRFREKKEGTACPLRKKIENLQSQDLIAKIESRAKAQSVMEDVFSAEQKSIMSDKNPNASISDLSQQFTLLKFAQIALHNLDNPGHLKTLNQADISDEIGKDMNPYLDQ